MHSTESLFIIIPAIALAQNIMTGKGKNERNKLMPLGKAFSNGIFG